jgi:hypothetical protein
LLATAALAAAACGGGSNVSNASPRITSVPQQVTTGNAAFTLDLGDFVSDREAATLTYAVTSGGGSFNGDVYSNTFDTMGTYTVEFTVTDGAKTTPGSFEVVVTAGNFVAVREDNDGLLLLDSRTNGLVRVSGATAAPTFETGLADGRLVYRQTASAGSDLFVFDPLTRRNVELAADQVGSVVYQAKTSDGRILYTVGSSVESTLYLYNPRTGLARPIAIGNLPEVLVNSSDLVFYEAVVNGQTDVFAYDIEDDLALAIADETRAETLRGVLPNGAAVIDRIGVGGESDLFYYRTGTGLVEIGADVSAIASADKVYHAFGSGNQVVFSATGSGATDLYFWDPASGQTTSISAAFTAGEVDVFAAMGAGNEVVFNRVVSGTEADLYCYDIDNATSATLRNAGDISEVLGISGDGSTNWAFVRPSGTTSSVLAISLVGAPATQTWAAGAAVATALGLLGNGDVVARRSDGGALDLFDVSAGTWNAAIVGTGLAFGGDGIDTGDFVYALTVNAQTDLAMWDASGAASVVVSDTAGNDAFQVRTADGTVLFTRANPSRTVGDLFVWDGTDTTQLTDEDSLGLRRDHTVVGKYAGAR